MLKPRVGGWKRIAGHGDWRLLLPADRVLAFGLVTTGSCELRLSGRLPLRLGPGDYLMLADPSAWELSHGRADVISFEKAAWPMAGELLLGDRDAGLTTSLLAGHVDLGRVDAELVSSLIDQAVVRPASEAVRIAQLLRLIDDEVALQREIGAEIKGRLLELMLVEALCADDGSLSIGKGVLAGLSDPGIAASLRAIHAKPGEAWTVARLAGIASMSRSSFASRFERLVGKAPISYLAAWRMVLARRALRDGERTDAVAHRVGFGSSAAFCTAFARIHGATPSAFRRSRSTDLDAG